MFPRPFAPTYQGMYPGGGGGGETPGGMGRKRRKKEGPKGKMGHKNILKTEWKREKNAQTRFCAPACKEENNLDVCVVAGFDCS